VGVPVIQQVKIQAQVLIPLVKALQAELGEELVGRNSAAYSALSCMPVGAICGVYHRARIRAIRWLLHATH
jgi:hypothetical protein